LPKERIWTEWGKGAEGSSPSSGLATLTFSGWLYEHPELADMFHCQQDPAWHPEGSAYVHTSYVVAAAATICEREGLGGDDRLVAMFAALCHDMGKPSTTVFERDRWRSPGHAEAGVPIARRFLETIGAPER